MDGIFGNRWSGSGMSYCEHCQCNVRSATGFALPRTNDPRDPARRAYLAWHEQRLFELWRLWGRAIPASNPPGRVIAHAGGGALRPLGLKAGRGLAENLFSAPPPQHGPLARWA